MNSNAYSNKKTPTDKRNSYRTPPCIFAWAQKRWGKFDIDLAADESNTLCDKFYDKEQNALALEWRSKKKQLHGWCNPPYSDIDPWIKKAVNSMYPKGRGFSMQTTMLLPSLNGEKRDKIILDYAKEIVFIVGRISFLTPDGKKSDGNSRGSCLVHFPHREFSQKKRKPKVSYVLRKHMENPSLEMI